MSSTIGLDIEDSKKEFEDAQKEKTDRAAVEQNNLFPQDNLKNALDQKRNVLPSGSEEGPAVQ